MCSLNQVMMLELHVTEVQPRKFHVVLLWRAAFNNW